ncbi:hypothetical protein PS15m_003225 [Mucor circinelloides]
MPAILKDGGNSNTHSEFTAKCSVKERKPLAACVFQERLHSSSPWPSSVPGNEGHVALVD